MIVLSQLRPQPHNTFVQTFASRPGIRQKAFALLAEVKQSSMSERLLDLLMGLRSHLTVQERIMSQNQLPEEMTPKRVMEIGHDMRKLVAATLTSEELAELLPLETRLESITPEDRLAGLAPEEMATLREQIARFLQQQQDEGKA